MYAAWIDDASTVNRLVKAGAKLILVPSCTDSLAGFNRVRLCARARAVENQCFVAVIPLVGNAPWSGAIDENRGHAALFTPCDHFFPPDGVQAAASVVALVWGWLSQRKGHREALLDPPTPGPAPPWTLAGPLMMSIESTMLKLIGAP